MRLLFLASAACSLARAQFPPEPEGIQLIRSNFDNNVTISYKQVCGVDDSSLNEC